MTPGTLAECLRWLFWGLVYVVTMVGAVFVFARAGLLMWVALLAVGFVIGEDVQRKRRAGVAS